MDNVYIVMPAYNEAENIRDVVEQWHPIVKSIGNGSRLVIIDDGSKDGTFQLLNEMKANNEQLFPISKSNSGHGATLLFGYQYAIREGASFVFQTDSDGQTNPQEFWNFWATRHVHNFQIGIRNSRQDGVARVLVSLVLRIVILAIFRVNVKDANTPFRLLNTKKLTEIIHHIPPNHFLSNVLMSVIIVKKGENISWKPITFRPRQGGVNSINMRRIIKIGLSSLRDFMHVQTNLK